MQGVQRLDPRIIHCPVGVLELPSSMELLKSTKLEKQTDRNGNMFYIFYLYEKNIYI